MKQALTLNTNALDLAVAFAKAPDALEHNMRHQISRVVMEMARTAKGHAPKAMSGLVTSIKSAMVSPLEGEVVAAKNYAQAVEEGTGVFGPQGKASGVMPPNDNILDWMRVRKITPKDPNMSEDELEFLIARKIATQGTPAQPFFEPTLAEHKDNAERRIDLAITQTLRELAA